MMDGMMLCECESKHSEREQEQQHSVFFRTTAYSTDSDADQQRMSRRALICVKPCFGYRLEQIHLGLSRCFATVTPGAKAYGLYLKTIHQLEDVRKRQETKKSEKMYEAWNKTAVAKPKSAGIAVVRTLAKETKASSTRKSEEETLQQSAAAYLAEAANFQYPSALVRLGNYLLDEDGKRSLECYKSAGEKGSSEGWFNLGHLLWTGASTGVEPNQNEALVAFRKAIDLGDSDAKYFCGVHYLGQEQTEGIDKISDQQALDWILEAADNDHGGALHYLTVFFLNGYVALNIAPCSTTEFQHRLKCACKHDSSGDAHFLLGSCFYSGDHGYKQDKGAALEHFLKAADLDHADAAVSAGAMVFTGEGVTQNQAQAFDLYQHAGELGNLEGWRNVVACYATGQGVKQSMETARYIAKTMLKE